MKIFKSLLLSTGLVLAMGALSVYAGNIVDYDIPVTTNTPTESATRYTNGGYPNISGGAWLDKLIIQSSGPVLNNGQTVTVYDVCTASHTATAAFTVFLSTSIAIGTPIQMDFPEKRYKLTSPCIAVDGATSNIKSKWFVE